MDNRVPFVVDDQTSRPMLLLIELSYTLVANLKHFIEISYCHITGLQVRGQEK